MSIGAIVTIISSLLKIAASVIGDYYLAKWITAARVWWRQFAWEALKVQVEEEFRKVQDDWKDFDQDRPDRQPIPNPPPAK